MIADSNIPAHKTQLQDYFDGVGFERWSAIYDGDDQLSGIRQTVREGHEQMLAQAWSWLQESHDSGTILDAGCGTGVFGIDMAGRGFDVTAVDIAPRMVEAARAKAERLELMAQMNFVTGDIESVDGQFAVVACFDVLVHYPREAFTQLCTFLADRCDSTLILTYAPYNSALALMHWVGGMFPHGQRRTEIQMIRDQVVVDTLAAAGMSVRRTASISRGFYHVKLLEAKRVSSSG